MKLAKPVEWGGQTIEEISPVYDGLTTGDVLTCVEQADLLTQQIIQDIAQDLHVQTVIAARAAGVVPPLLRGGIGGRDLLRICAGAGAWLRSGEALAMDLDALTSGQILAAADEALRLAPGGTPVLRLSVHYHLALAARATGKSLDELRALPGADGAATLREVRRFLLEA